MEPKWHTPKDDYKSNNMFFLNTHLLRSDEKRGIVNAAEIITTDH